MPVQMENSTSPKESEILNNNNNKIFESNTTNNKEQYYKECIYDLCTVSPEYYPTADIKQILNGSKLYTDWPINEIYDDDKFVQNRFGFNPEGERFCEINTFVLKPQLGKNIHNEERFIVNVDTKPQEIFVETCAEKECIFNDMILPISYTTECVQRFFHIPMLVYHLDEIRIDYIRFPSCCVCYVKHTFN